MNIEQLSGLSNKINELKTLFTYGQRVIPFLEELFTFVQEVIPLLDEINISIQESTLKMPRASSQLSKVTRATELATTEILDTIDNTLLNLGKMKSEFADCSELVEKVIKIDSGILQMLRKELSGSHEALVKEINRRHKQKRGILNNLLRYYDSFSGSLDDIHDNSSNIMMSLQVQDITAQQIAAVNHLIESIAGKLGDLMSLFHDYGTKLPPAEEKPADQSFNPEANYDNTGKRQQEADAIIRKARAAAEKTSSDQLPGPTPQVEIDKIFQQESPETTAIAKRQPGKENDRQSTSQDEIDEIFQQ